MSITFPGESAEYRAARDRLLEREIELRREMEAVAAARRELPPGGVVPEDYVLQGKAPDGNPADVRMWSFPPGKDSLVIYNFMFPQACAEATGPGPPRGETALLPLEEGPCPSWWPFSTSSTALRNTQVSNELRSGGEDAVVAAHHLGRRARLAEAAAPHRPQTPTTVTTSGLADDPSFRCSTCSTATAEPSPLLGRGAHLRAGQPGGGSPSVGTLEPLWNLFDLTRRGARTGISG